MIIGKIIILLYDNIKFNKPLQFRVCLNFAAINSISQRRFKFCNHLLKFYNEVLNIEFYS